MAKKKLKRYKKLRISHDCLVPKGAMQVESVFKEEKDHIAFTKTKTNEQMVTKFDDEKQIMYNIMVKWNKPDSDGWVLDDEDVRRDAMIDFHENGSKTLKFTHKKDESGEPYNINAHVMELYYVKDNDPIYPDYVGSIARSAYFEDKEEYELVKTLDFQSSIEGTAVLEDYVDKSFDKKVHKIKDLLKKIFNVDTDKFTQKSFKDIIDNIVEKDFDSVLEDRKNNDFYYAISALNTALYDAEWQYVYGMEKDIDGLKKEAKKIVKQFLKYVDDMSFEIVSKENTNEEGEEMERQEEIEAIVNESIQKTIGLEEGQTLVDLIKNTVGEQKPAELPTVKDADGNEKTIVEVLEDTNKVNKELSTKVENLEKQLKKSNGELEELKKSITDNQEIPPDEQEEIEKKQKRLKKEAEKSSGLL